MNNGKPQFLRTLPLFFLSLVVSASTLAAPQTFTITQHVDGIKVAVDGKPIALYVWGDEALPRPYFRKLTTPPVQQQG